MEQNKFKVGDIVKVKGSKEAIDKNNICLTLTQAIFPSYIDLNIINAEKDMVGKILTNFHDLYVIELANYTYTICSEDILEKCSECTNESKTDDEEYEYQMVLNLNHDKQKGFIISKGKKILEFKCTNVHELFGNLEDVFKKAMFHKTFCNVIEKSFEEDEGEE